MIEFDCPECGAWNEVSDRKAGRRVRCIKCDERIDVPEEVRPKRKSLADDKPRVRDKLTQQEYILYGIAFLAFPAINVVVSSILYYAWRGSLPTKAYQINQLGWAIFGIQFLPMCGCVCLGAFLGPRPQRGPRGR